LKSAIFSRTAHFEVNAVKFLMIIAFTIQVRLYRYMVKFKGTVNFKTSSFIGQNKAKLDIIVRWEYGACTKSWQVMKLTMGPVVVKNVRTLTTLADDRA